MASTLLPQEIIRRKRDGYELEERELRFLVQGITDGSITEGQIAAFAMAVFFRGLNLAERVALTLAMTESGTVLDWSAVGLDGPVLDKHSTGGVGDKVSLILAPLIAACGAYVPMISGRGLGHTGGTLDKLDSLPGYDTAPDPARFRKVVKETGCAIVGQTADLAPADRRFYAVRDVTATVESIGLITASILSKKLAAGLQGLVMDVKTGSGAFITTSEQARELAESLVTVAQGAGLPTTALITDMNQVLGHSAGNALEVRESLDFLTGVRRDQRLQALTLALGAEMLMLGKLADNREDTCKRLKAALKDGRAAECFARMVAALGGPRDVLTKPQLPQAPVTLDALPAGEGFVSAMDVRAIGIAIINLGGGRRRADAGIDYAVGLSDICQIGDHVDKRTPLAKIHARSKAQAEAAAEAVRTAVTLNDKAPASTLVIAAMTATE